jgi:hypothetical protein
MNHTTLPSSFRDPSGFMFQLSGSLYRQVNKVYQEHYDYLISSGLYSTLVDRGLLIPHREVDSPLAVQQELAYKVIQPELISMISYPYEWSFVQLKDAALLTLDIQKIALVHGMTLKDSTAYNIQFHKGKPILIDSLSFEIYNEGSPWAAYGQFCRHFYAPLTLMSKCDIRLNQLFRTYMDGIPLDLASNLLSKKSYMNLSILANIHLHSNYQKRYANKQVRKSDLNNKMKKSRLLALLNSLQSSIESMRWDSSGTEWGDYYNDTNYSEKGLKDKRNKIEQYLLVANPTSVWDIGGNVGLFSRIASSKGIRTVCFDIDPAAIDKNYQEVKKNNESSLLPLLMDLTNPSSGIGWSNNERESLLERGPADMVFALALIHHLAISNHVPFERLAEFFSKIGRHLIIEYVPKKDSQVQRLLASREDVFHNYTEQNFLEKFSQFFDLISSHQIIDSERTLYYFKNNRLKSN